LVKPDVAGDDEILPEEPIGLFLVFADRLFAARISHHDSPGLHISPSAGLDYC
jgi:hypothetical protein